MASAQSLLIFRESVSARRGGHQAEPGVIDEGNPASVKVGTFGNSGMRLAVAAAIARTLPASTGPAPD